jgi:UrcA family protein
MNTKLSTALIATTLLASLALCGPARAQTPTGDAKSAPSEVVRYSDLDLSSPAGIRTLYGRIQNAAWRVCLLMVPAPGIESGKCRQTLIDVAVGEVNKPALTALHTRKNSVDLSARR